MKINSKLSWKNWTNSIMNTNMKGKVILHIYVPQGFCIYSTARKIYERNQDEDYEAKTTCQIANIALIKDADFTDVLTRREFLNPYLAKFIIEKNIIKTQNANRTNMVGNIDINSFEPHPKNHKIAKVFHEIGWTDELESGVRNFVKYTKIYSGGTPKYIIQKEEI